MDYNYFLERIKDSLSFAYKKHEQARGKEYATPKKREKALSKTRRYIDTIETIIVLYKITNNDDKFIEILKKQSERIDKRIGLVKLYKSDWGNYKLKKFKKEIQYGLLKKSFRAVTVCIQHYNSISLKARKAA